MNALTLYRGVGGGVHLNYSSLDECTKPYITGLFTTDYLVTSNAILGRELGTDLQTLSPNVGPQE